MSNLRHMSKKR